MRPHLFFLSLLLLSACAVETPATVPKCPPEAVAPKPSPTAELDPALGPYAFLLGQWEASSSAAGSGVYSFEPDVQGHVIVRHNTSNTPQGRHDDLLVMYVARQGEVRALYTDNEGHVIDYAVTAMDNPKRAVFVSSESPGAPRFRLSYELEADGSVHGRFEMAPPGGSEFKGYLEWRAHRK